MKNLDIIACLLASIAVNVSLAVAWHRLRNRRRPLAPVVSLPGPGHCRVVKRGEAS